MCAASTAREQTAYYVKVLKEEKVTLNGQVWNHMEYTVPIGATDFTYSNYFLGIPGKGAIQILFFTTSPLFEAQRPAIGKAVATLRVGTGLPSGVPRPVVKRVIVAPAAASAVVDT